MEKTQEPFSATPYIHVGWAESSKPNTVFVVLGVCWASRTQPNLRFLVTDFFFTDFLGTRFAFLLAATRATATDLRAQRLSSSPSSSKSAGTSK